ncbi:MAG: PEP-CTERM sorting domain-containing protein [Bacillati bacterium ANGP1]|uniref:PEP-CTERM sorting domain-containing protein n=1 Tax=Candidatus Segetimicrobium genomatis TaxID=2569760 RepID=A0A537K2Q0_9BACT|nr:MAG: PEP-CTERM sorting domain-containing protein [Terrabacteria group bacterium ANGP1]
MGRYKSLCMLAAAGLLFGIFGVSTASATLVGTMPLPPGGITLPGFTSDSPGTLLASESVPFVSTLGNDSGTLTSAVYQESGGTLDFYYQVINNLTAPNCGGTGQPGCDPIGRETNTSFTGFQTAVGFRTDGGSLGGPFVNGSVPPFGADRNSTGNVVGFDFNLTNPIQPGATSDVLVISTDATNFNLGHASVIDGGTSTVDSYEPAAVPEPGSMLLLSTGMLGMFAMRRSRR